MKVHDLAQRDYDGLLGIVTRVRKSDVITVLITVDSKLCSVDAFKRDWKVVSKRRKRKNKKKLDFCIPSTV